MVKRKGTILQITIRKTKDWAAQKPQKPGVNCSTNGIRHVTIDTNPVIRNEWGKDLVVLMRSGAYFWTFVTQVVCND